MADKQRVLLVEDDPNLGQILKEYLELKGFQTTLARDGQEGLEKFKVGQFVLCILDVMMPKKDGFELAGELKNMDSDIPVIFLTAKTMKEDAIKGLTLGADDYITKPFSMEELLLRIKAILKRTNQQPPALAEEVQLGNYTFHPDKRELALNGSSRTLTTKENELLKMFVSRKNQVLSRKTALQHIWGDDSYFNARSMDVYVAKLRKYLNQDDSLQILTVHGEGFKLVKF
ncbi:response regulator transcription factor [Fulvivirga lutimaris]|uniref:response regulator transcription factor n=1 Tax=Fulvivirga lutimaris TaxID=1819566 RepID=UPI0012BBB674|nr:response regulator transcription factor [Fulvivirga lutimaris]MTI38475.1 response regulator transcription factor [Fulvivirga lutimaris]